ISESRTAVRTRKGTPMALKFLREAVTGFVRRNYEEGVARAEKRHRNLGFGVDRPRPTRSPDPAPAKAEREQRSLWDPSPLPGKDESMLNYLVRTDIWYGDT